MFRHGSGSVASGSDAEHFAIKLSLVNIFGQIIPKGLVFPFLCMRVRNIALPKPSCMGCSLSGKVEEGFKSLLGNDILSCFDIEIKRFDKQILLTKISDLTGRNKDYPWCEMHSLEQK